MALPAGTRVRTQPCCKGPREVVVIRFGRRYDALISEGKKLNPAPPRTGKRGRPALGPAGSLLARLATYRDDVLRFATDFRVLIIGFRLARTLK